MPGIGYWVLSAGRRMLGAGCLVLCFGRQVLGAGCREPGFGCWGHGVLGLERPAPRHPALTLKTHDIKAQDRAPRTLHSASSNRLPAARPKTKHSRPTPSPQPPNTLHSATSTQDQRPNAKPLTPQHPSPRALVLASCVLDLSTWFLVLFSWVLGVGS